MYLRCPECLEVRSVEGGVGMCDSLCDECRDYRRVLVLKTVDLQRKHLEALEGSLVGWPRVVRRCDVCMNVFRVTPMNHTICSDECRRIVVSSREKRDNMLNKFFKPMPASRNPEKQITNQVTQTILDGGNKRGKPAGEDWMSRFSQSYRKEIFQKQREDYRKRYLNKGNKDANQEGEGRVQD